jgi:hypothetical protein
MPRDEDTEELPVQTQRCHRCKLLSRLVSVQMKLRAISMNFTRASRIFEDL